MNAEMVNAVLDGRKTQTRRIIDWKRLHKQAGLPFPTKCKLAWYRILDSWGLGTEDNYIGEVKCPYGKKGDQLWVREAWSGIHAFRDIKPSERQSYIGDGTPYQKEEVWYWADGDTKFGDWESPRPSIHMPRWASRINLEIVDIRVERVQDISEEDAKAEGVIEEVGAHGPIYKAPNLPNGCSYGSAKQAFKTLWDSINKKRGVGWDEPRWVWVVEFKEIK